VPEPVELRDGGRRPLLRFSSGSVVLAVVLVLATGLLLRVVAAAATPLLWYLGGAIGAALLFPLVSGLSRVMPRGLAIALVAVGSVVVAGFVSYRVVDELQSQAERFAEEAPEAARDLEESESFGEAAREFGLEEKVAALARDVETFGRFRDPLDAARTAATTGASGFAVWMLGLLMLVAGPRFVAAGLHQVPEERRDEARAVLVRAYRRAWSYIALMVARGVLLGIVTALTAAAAGLPTPALLGTWVAAWSLVPGLGLVVGGMPVVVVAALSGPQAALGALVAALAVQVADVLVVQRRIDRRTLHVGPAITLAASVVGLALYGPGGMVMALSLAIFAVGVVLEATVPNEGAPHGDAQSDEAAKVSQSSGSPPS
jgi:predicted PurR-regulated permease PerM